LTPVESNSDESKIWLSRIKVLVTRCRKPYYLHSLSLIYRKFASTEFETMRVNCITDIQYNLRDYRLSWLPLTSLTLPHCCACPKPRPGFPMSCVMHDLFCVQGVKLRCDCSFYWWLVELSVHHLICLYPLILTTALRTLELTVFFWLGCCPPTYTFIDPGNTKQWWIQNVLLSMIDQTIFPRY
jgi:hypothetical protein